MSFFRAGVTTEALVDAVGRSSVCGDFEHDVKTLMMAPTTCILRPVVEDDVKRAVEDVIRCSANGWVCCCGKAFPRKAAAITCCMSHWRAAAEERMSQAVHRLTSGPPGIWLQRGEVCLVCACPDGGWVCLGESSHLCVCSECSFCERGQIISHLTPRRFCIHGVTGKVGEMEQVLTHLRLH